MIPRKNSPEKLSSLLDGFLDNPIYSQYMLEGKLKENWSNLVGDRVAEIAVIASFEPPELKLKIESPAWKMELSYRKDEILEKVNTFLNSKVINRLTFI